MLERFHVPVELAVRVDSEALRSMAVSLFEKVGVPPDDAAVGADALIVADLRGVDTPRGLQHAAVLHRGLQLWDHQCPPELDH